MIREASGQDGPVQPEVQDHSDFEHEPTPIYRQYSIATREPDP